MNMANTYGKFSSSKGLSLVELMISITLGLLIVAATISIFSANKQTNTASEDIGRVQENARAAFELLGKDIRTAGESPCSRLTDGINVNTGVVWSNRIQGADAVNGALQNDSLTLQMPSNQMFDVTLHTSGAGGGTVDMNTQTPFQAWPSPVTVLICDFKQSAIFNATPNFNVTATTGTQVTYNGVLGLDSTQYVFRPHSRIARIENNTWAIVGANLQRNGQDLVTGVRSLEMTYLLPGAVNYVTAAAVPAGRWDEVIAVRMLMELQGDNLTGTNGQVLRRRIMQTFNLRGRAV